MFIICEICDLLTKNRLIWRYKHRTSSLSATFNNSNTLNSTYLKEILQLEMEPGLRVSDFDRVGSGHRSACQTRCLTRFWVLTYMWRCFYRITPSWQTNICSFDFISTTALLVYLLHFVLIIFAYLRVYLGFLAVNWCYCQAAVHDTSRPGLGNVKILTWFHLYLWYSLYLHTHTMCLENKVYSILGITLTN